jgi:ribonuclease P protein component
MPNSLDRDRLGIIASRRLGNAVVRNRAKRRLRELFRHLEPDTAAARRLQPFDFVIIPRRELATAPFDELAREFRLALSRIDRARRT